MTFAELTWEDLREWAGAKVVTRGKSYLDAVKEVCLTDDGRLIAWVKGTHRYATAVSLDPQGKPSSTCTCPYASDCKHAVATVLAYLDKVQANEPVPMAMADDERLGLLVRDDDHDDDIFEEAGTGDAPSPAKGARRRASSRETATTRYLATLSQADLAQLIQQLCADFPDVRKRLDDIIELQSGDVAKLIANTRREIRHATAEPAWHNHWTGEGYTPDFSRVKRRLQALLKAGHADEVVRLGEELWRSGNEQLETSDDEGEAAQELADAMEVAFRAIAASPRPGPEKLLWEIKIRDDDQFCTLDGTKGPWSRPKDYSRDDWSAVADELTQRLGSPAKKTGRSSSGDNRHDYRRAEIMGWLLQSLPHARRSAEITAVLLREAEPLQCYERLVSHLLSLGRKDEAMAWARKGFANTVGNLAGVAWHLEEQLRQEAESRGDLPMVAAYRAMEFFDRPALERYGKLREATIPLGLWDAIRPQLLAWLETGRRPDGETSPGKPVKGVRKATENPSAAPAWPLPPTGLSVPPEKHGRYVPHADLLLDIAIAEQRHDDAIHWYRLGQKRDAFGNNWQQHYADKVACAIQKTHPDEALAIWRKLADSIIAQGNPNTYDQAGGILRRMHKLYLHAERLDEWRQLTAELRDTHRRRRRFLEVLDTVEGKRQLILTGKSTR